jgi:hypothetical protein
MVKRKQKGLQKEEEKDKQINKNKAVTFVEFYVKQTI